MSMEDGLYGIPGNGKSHTITIEKVYQFRNALDGKIKEIDKEIKLSEEQIEGKAGYFVDLLKSHITTQKNKRCEYVDLLHKFTDIMGID